MLQDRNYCVFGAFGGLTYAIASLLDGGKKEDVWEACRGASLPAYLWGQAIIGCGGAFAAMFAILTLGHAVQDAPNGATDSAISVYLVALCVVGGFVGNRLLTGVGLNLAQQLTHLKQDTKRAVAVAHKAEEASKEASAASRQFSDMTLDIVIARDEVANLESIHASKSPLPTDLRTKAESSLKKLSEYARHFPADRVLNIVLANLKFELGSPLDAVAQLESFLAERRKVDAVLSDDDATAYFNIACYLSRSADNAEGEKQKNLRESALAAIRKSLEIAKHCGDVTMTLHKSRAESDTDLAGLREGGRLQNTIKEVCER